MTFLAMTKASCRATQSGTGCDIRAIKSKQTR
jgi:hypothetical protein